MNICLKHKLLINSIDKNLEKKIKFDTGIPEDIFYAFKRFYTNVNFHSIDVSSINILNVKLEFLDNNIIFREYIHKRFKSNCINPQVPINKIRLCIKGTKYKKQIFITVNLVVKFSKKSKIHVKYIIKSDIKNIREIDRFINVCLLYKQYKYNQLHS